MDSERLHLHLDFADMATLCFVTLSLCGVILEQQAHLRQCMCASLQLQNAPVPLKAAAKPAEGHRSAKRVLGQRQKFVHVWRSLHR